MPNESFNVAGKDDTMIDDDTTAEELAEYLASAKFAKRCRKVRVEQDGGREHGLAELAAKLGLTENDLSIFLAIEAKRRGATILDNSDGSSELVFRN